tara:strand:+ start:30 stop:569 length:540 start_codon:yes stop_codon:yes gene_type:complete
MALWGKIDNVLSTGTVSVNYDTRTITGTATSFGEAGSAQVGDIIRFGVRDGGGTYFGDAQITDIASATSCTIGSTMGLSGAAMAGVVFEVSELPKSTALDPAFSELSGTGPSHDQFVYAITDTTGYSERTDKFRTGSTGWVGVTTYTDMHGNFRVKHECLVAMSGITTGTGSLLYPRTN